MNYYAIKYIGGLGEIVDSWEQCMQNINDMQEMVKGYELFHNIDEARRHIGLPCISKIKSISQTNTLNCYVDGSYCYKTRKYGAGVHMLHDDEFIDNISKAGDDSVFIGMRNVAGEIVASLLALEYAIDNKYKEVKIFYDYKGIECWATDQWKANKEGTIYYKNKFQELVKNSGIQVTFVKVKAHSGDELNDMADRLAKDAIGIK